MEINKNTNDNANRIGSGLILLVLGLIFFCRNFGIDIPGWLFSWPVLLICAGLLVGYKRDFKGNKWLIMVLIGGFFMLKRISDMDLASYYFAAGLIILGLYLILNPTAGNKDRWKKKRTADFSFSEEQMNPDERASGAAGGAAGQEASGGEDSSEDYVKMVNVFGGSNQQVYTKNFRGGDVVSIFGGGVIDFTHADFQELAVLDVVVIFGGAKIIIPPGWIVKSELTPMFGGVDDKRSVIAPGPSAGKLIKIKGVALFGGVEIRNF